MVSIKSMNPPQVMATSRAELTSEVGFVDEDSWCLGWKWDGNGS
jgi:hypothetical protein